MPARDLMSPTSHSKLALTSAGGSAPPLTARHTCTTKTHTDTDNGQYSSSRDTMPVQVDTGIHTKSHSDARTANCTALITAMSHALQEADAAPAHRADRLAHAAARTCIAAATVTRQYRWPSSSTTASATGAAPMAAPKFQAHSHTLATSTKIPHSPNTFFCLGTAAVLCSGRSAGGALQGWLGKRYRINPSCNVRVYHRSLAKPQAYPGPLPSKFGPVGVVMPRRVVSQHLLRFGHQRPRLLRQRVLQHRHVDVRLLRSGRGSSDSRRRCKGPQT